MNNNQWITDRLPTEDDAQFRDRIVWVMSTNVIGKYDVYMCDWDDVKEGQPWQPITVPDPYVKPKQYRVGAWASNMYGVYQESGDHVVASHIPTKEAAERIAAIYEEVMP